MIILPALSAVIGLLVTILEPILISVGIGAAVGGGIGAVGGVVEGYREHGEINSEVVAVVVENTAHGAADGILWGGVFGVVGVIAAPIMPLVGGAIRPVVAVADDVTKPVVELVGKAVKPILGAVDDITGPTFSGVRSTTSSAAYAVANKLAAPNKIVNAAQNASNFRTLPRAVCSGGCIYIMDDTANGLSKVGVTTNPQRRLADVSRQVSSDVRYISVAPIDDAYAAEAALKRQFVSKNVPHPNHATGTEWFSGLSPMDVATAMSK